MIARLLLAAVLAIAPTNARAAPAPPTLTVTLTPSAADPRGHVPEVAVSITADAVEAGAGSAVFSLPVTANTVVTSADALRGLRFTLDNEPLRLDVRDDAEDASNTTRRWLAPMAVKGRVTASYRVPIDAGAAPIAKPQYELRTEGGAFSGAGNAFLLRPADDRTRVVRVRWDLSRMGSGSRAVSSFGEGDAAGAVPRGPDDLASSYFMAGRIGLFASRDGRFTGAWMGDPPFDMAASMAWAAKLQAFYHTFFQRGADRFVVFARPNPVNPGSGIGLTDSFAFTFNQASRPADLKGLLAHEMLHAWVRSLDESMDRPGGLDRSWFGEGLAVHYQRLLPRRAGLISDEEFLADLNETAGRYYTNVMIGVPNADIPAGFWRDTRIRVLPYDRGSLYFAALDAELRKASGGKRSLDDLVRAMLDARDQGRAMDEALWRTLLAKDLGVAGPAALDAMLAGETVLPPGDAFGAKFCRTKTPLRRFDLGFDPASLLAQPRRVAGVKPGSQAALAGLRDGDIILHPFPQDALQGDQRRTLTLDIERDGKPLTLTYLPRGEAVPAYQWEHCR